MVPLPAQSRLARRRRGRKRSRAGEGSSQGEGEGDGGGKVKWGKLARQVLKQQPERRMRWKKLWRALLELGRHDAAADLEALQQLCLRKLHKCGAVRVEGKVVELLA